jgi:hypothetical protein
MCIYNHLSFGGQGRLGQSGRGVHLRHTGRAGHEMNFSGSHIQKDVPYYRSQPYTVTHGGEDDQQSREATN